MGWMLGAEEDSVAQVPTPLRNGGSRQSMTVGGIGLTTGDGAGSVAAAVGGMRQARQPSNGEQGQW